MMASAVSLLLLLLLQPTARALSLSTKSPSARGLSGLERSIASLAATAGIVQIDVENVRGKSGFCLDHDALLAATAQWTAAHELQGRVVLVVDHGDVHQGFYLRRHGVAVVFAGNRQKADDVLALNVGYFSAVQRRDSIVITADAGLRQRCRTKAHSARRLHLVQPSRFLESLVAAAEEALPEEALGTALGSTGFGASGSSAGASGGGATGWSEDAELRRELRKLEMRLDQCTAHGKRAKIVDCA
jgi:hypothetical protein